MCILAGNNDDLIYLSSEVYVMLRSSYSRAVLSHDSMYSLSVYVSLLAVIADDCPLDVRDVCKIIEIISDELYSCDRSRISVLGVLHFDNAKQ